MDPDCYLSIAEAAEITLREKSSRFIAYAFPVDSDVQVKAHLDVLRAEHFSATHHCWASRLGAPPTDTARNSDDGEPAGTAGKPILGQMLSHGLTNIMIVVVRYFGGTKLGVPGLIAAYKEAADAVIGQCRIVERTVDESMSIVFPYHSLGAVMKTVKELHPNVLSQQLDNVCTMELSIRKGSAQRLREKLSKCEGLHFCE